MKIIFDESLKDTTIRISPRRIFECVPCGWHIPRKKVNKIRGDYFCPRCGRQVEDVTNTTTGQSILEITNL
jgi:predicted RNA-binding Zn-ribbon protein involved in translation (DUF1610 family)